VFKKKIKTLIVGLGNIGLKYDLNLKDKNHYTTHAKSVFFTKSFKLLGGVDNNYNSRKIFEKEYRLPAYHEVNTAIEIQKPDMVIIATNELYHLKIIKQISQFDFVKYIVLEKPAGKNYQELKMIFKICKKKNKKLLINYFRLYNPYYKKIISNLKKEKLFCLFHYNRGISNNCSHIISFLLSISAPKKIGDIKLDLLSNSQKQVISLRWNKIHCLLINPGIKKLSHTKLEIYLKNKHIVSNNDLSELHVAKIDKSKVIKDFYEFKNYFKHLNKYKNCYQKVFYENFQTNIKLEDKYNKIVLMTSLLLNKLKKYEIKTW
jgi:hypothetical protein